VSGRPARGSAAWCPSWDLTRPPPALEVKEAYKQALAEARSLVVDGRLTVDLDGHQEPPPANDTGEPPTGPTAEDPAPDSDAPGVASEPDPATTPTKKYRVHPAAAIYPMMSATEIQALATSLREIGQQEPIIVSPDDEELYDGRNRLAACELAGIEPWIVRCPAPGPSVMWITSKNPPSASPHRPAAGPGGRQDGGAAGRRSTVEECPESAEFPGYRRRAEFRPSSAHRSRGHR
jgi:hypothetical protein